MHVNMEFCSTQSFDHSPPLFLSIATNLMHMMRTSSMTTCISVYHRHQYINMSQEIAIYCLILFYRANKDELHPMKLSRSSYASKQSSFSHFCKYKNKRVQQITLLTFNLYKYIMRTRI